MLGYSRLKKLFEKKDSIKTSSPNLLHGVDLNKWNFVCSFDIKVLNSSRPGEDSVAAIHLFESKEEPKRRKYTIRTTINNHNLKDEYWETHPAVVKTISYWVAGELQNEHLKFPTIWWSSYAIAIMNERGFKINDKNWWYLPDQNIDPKYQKALKKQKDKKTEEKITEKNDNVIKVDFSGKETKKDIDDSK